MVGLVDEAFFLLFPWSMRSTQCTQRVQETRRGLLVCLPYLSEPHQKALSWTSRDGNPRALREGGAGTKQLTFSRHSCHRNGNALVGAAESAALYQALSSSPAKFTGRSIPFAPGTCRLTHKPARTGRYASGEENGEDMRQIF